VSTWQGGNAYPSIDEFNGYYNVPDQYEDIGPVLRVSEQLPEFDFPEFWDVFTAAREWLASVMPPPDEAPFDPLAEDEFVPWDDADDRTLRVEHGAYDRLSVGFLRRIQQDFLRRFPLWRVHLIGEDAETSILIYPKVIRFANEPVDVDPWDALRRLVPRGIALREARQRADRARLTYLQRRLPDAVQAIGQQPYAVVGLLDDGWSAESRMLIWILVRGNDDYAINVEGPNEADRDFLATTSGYGVDAQGVIISAVEIPKTAPFCVMVRYPPKEYRGPLTIIERASGKRHVYEVKSENIASLAEVMSQLGR
jgi:hypothetical protein